jgi:hypothetical protein
MDSNKLMLFPNLFWATVALLHVDYEELFLHAVRLLTSLLERLNLNDRALQNVLYASTPKARALHALPRLCI